jgi:WD40 repeat protein
VGAAAAARRSFPLRDKVFDYVLLPRGLTPVTAQHDGIVRWVIEPSPAFFTMRESGPAEVAAVSPDGTLVASIANRSEVSFWDPFQQTRVGHVNLGGILQQISFTRDGSQVALIRISPREEGSPDTRSVWILSVPTGVVISRIPLSSSAVAALAPSANRLVIGEDVRVRMYDLDKHETIWSQAQANNSVVSFNPDGNYVVSAGKEREAVARDSETGVELFRLRGHLAPILSVAFSPDGKTIATGDTSGVIKLWHAATHEELLEFERADDECRKLLFTRDGRYLTALIGGKELLLFEAVVPESR